MTRIEAAEAIAEVINAYERHSAILWARDTSIRLYLKYNVQRNTGWIDNGLVTFLLDGTIDVHAERCASVIKEAVRQFQSTQSSISPEPHQFTCVECGDRVDYANIDGSAIKLNSDIVGYCDPIMAWDYCAKCAETILEFARG